MYETNKSVCIAPAIQKGILNRGLAQTLGRQIITFMRNGKPSQSKIIRRRGQGAENYLPEVQTY